MNHPNRKEIITVLVDGRTKAKLRRLAGDSYRTLSGYVRHLILAHIREAEALRGPIPDEEPLCPGPGRGLVLALVGLDQLVKFLVRAYIPLGGDVPFLPHILQLTYVQNTGAAFSIFSQHTWILTVVSLVVSVALAVLLLKKVFPHPLAMLTLSLVLAGAVGNLIDRAVFGYVTDMFQTLFIHFAVFNVADICVVCGGIGFCVYYLFFHGRGDGHGADSAEG